MPDTLTVVLTRWGDVETQIGHLNRGACFVPLPEPSPEPFEDLGVVMVTPAGSFEFEAQVMQLLPPVGMALSCTNPDELRAWLESMLAMRSDEGENPGDAYVQWGRPATEEPDPEIEIEEPLPEPNEEPSEDTRETPMHDRIAEMTTSAKLQLALHGDKTARTLLLRDPNKHIHAYIIQNKGITLDEVRFIAGFRQANPDVLKQIGENRDWMQNPRIVAALVTNPKTPPSTATKLLSLLPITELRRIAKSQNVPRSVSAAARRMVVGD